MATPERPVWVTGLGFVSPGLAGGTVEAALLRSWLRPAGAPLPAAAERALTDFDFPGLLGPKGLRHLGRGTLCLISAASLALRDSGLTGEVLATAGVAVGTATAAAAIVADFDRTTLVEGPQAPNPGLFPQTVWNGAASQISIRQGLRGPNLTICSGLNSGLDAVIAAARSISLGGASLFLAGGFEEISPYFRVIFSGGSLERAPVPLCEGAAVLVLEEGTAASDRGAQPLARIVGWGSEFAAPKIGAGPPMTASPYAGAGLVWHHGVTPLVAAAERAGAVQEIVPQLGCGGGFTGALAALIAAASGDVGARGSALIHQELVTADDGRGRHSVLQVERTG